MNRVTYKMIGGLVGLLLLISSNLASAEGFLPGLEDVPVMDGLAVEEEGTMLFDSPSGRIVEVFASGAVNRSDVGGFYASTLPELGWQTAGSNRFQREGEQLAIDFFGPDGTLSVRFTLAPL